MNLSPRDTAIQLAQSSAIPHISINEVRALGDAAGEAARNAIAYHIDENNAGGPAAPVLLRVVDRPPSARSRFCATVGSRSD